MRLIPNFQDLLQTNQLPKRFGEWWIVEEEDRMFADKRFDFLVERYWDAWDIRSFLKTTKRELGFFRKKNTPEEVRLQQCFLKQFPEELILALGDLSKQLGERREIQQHVRSWKESFDPTLTPEEQVTAFQRVYYGDAYEEES